MPTWGFSLLLQEEFFLLSHLRIHQKQQVPSFLWLLGAFALPKRLLQNLKSNKYLRFRGYLGLFALLTGRILAVTASSNSSKATSTPVFMATWGFCPSAASAPKPKKQQVPLFSWLLGAFALPRRLLQKRKSNKFPCFHGYLGLFALLTGRIRSVTASSLSPKATSTPVFMATWGF